MSRIQDTVTLSEEQTAAVNRLLAFYMSAYATEQTCSFIGCAGTGKTTVLQACIERIYLEKPKVFDTVYFSSPTHRANAVLRKFIGTLPYAVYTLHSLFGLRPDIDLETFDATQVTFSKKVDVEMLDNSLLIIDEASMINDALYAFILERAKEKCVKVLFVGDDGQLKPVKQEHVSKAFYDVDCRVVLQKNMRTDNVHLVSELKYIRETGQFSRQSFDAKSVCFTQSSEAFLASAIAKFCSKDFLKDRFYVRMLSATNARVQEFSKCIRQALFRYYADQEYCVGDILMAYSNAGGVRSNGLPYIMNSCDYVVTKVGKLEVKYYAGICVEVYPLELLDLFSPASRKKHIHMLSLENDSTVFTLLGQRFEELRQSAIQLSKVKSKYDYSGVTAWRKFYSFCDAIYTPIDILYEGYAKIRRTLQYGYAHTIHKSQGGTYQHSYVDDHSIERSFYTDQDIQRQLRYVGASRASKSLTVLLS